jgi:sirohydrochlorin ferrochelatase
MSITEAKLSITERKDKTPTNTQTAVAYVAHGSRHPAWRQSLEPLLNCTRDADPGLLFGIAFVGLCDPSLPDLLATFVTEGVTSVTIVPLFIAPGKHVTDDIPQAVEQARATYPGVEFRLTRCVGQLRGVQAAIVAEALTMAGVAAV